MKYVAIIIAILFSVGITSFIFTTCNNAADQAQEHVIKNSFDSYEEFQEMYNTCQQLNQDLCNLKEIPESDKMFTQFSKAEVINGKRQKLNRWIEDYNAKSKMWNRSMWKSKTLPYQLTTQDFSCY
jgi:tRNA U34 5-methylaminomethyl-2-thiouridine-forming methyltransferase MnmC